MPLGVQQSTDGHRLVGDGADVELANGFLAHLAVRNHAVASCRGYAYDLLNFLRFLADRGLRLAEVTPTDVFDYLDWQARRRQSSPGSAVVRLADRQGGCAVDNQPADRGGARAVRVRGHHRRPVHQSGAGGAPDLGAAGPARAARSSAAAA